jgi:hypothetical protein
LFAEVGAGGKRIADEKAIAAIVEAVLESCEAIGAESGVEGPFRRERQVESDCRVKDVAPGERIDDTESVKSGWIEVIEGLVNGVAGEGVAGRVVEFCAETGAGTGFSSGPSEFNMCGPSADGIVDDMTVLLNEFEVEIEGIRETALEPKAGGEDVAVAGMAMQVSGIAATLPEEVGFEDRIGVAEGESQDQT